MRKYKRFRQERRRVYVSKIDAVGAASSKQADGGGADEISERLKETNISSEKVYSIF